MTDLKILPEEGDHLVAKEALGVYGQRITRLGLLRFLAIEGSRMGSMQICESVGMASDFRLIACLRNVLYVCKRNGLVQEDRIAYNYHLYRIAPAGLDVLRDVNEILSEYGWGLPQEILDGKKAAQPQDTQPVTATEEPTENEPACEPV